MAEYYTPKIGEFYVGFEYELYSAGEEGSKKWIKKIIERSDYIHLIESYLRSDFASDKIRVKYLDREDVESLGFTLKWSEYNELSLENHDSILIQLRNDSYIEVFDNKIKDKFKSVLFRGTVKNKSELKKILEQLGIK